MEGMNEDYILESIFKLRTENTEVHDIIIDYFTNQYDEYSQSSEDDVSEGVPEQLENMNSKPAATVDPIKTSHLSNMRHH